MPAASKIEDGDAEHLYSPLGESTQRKRVEYWSKTYRKWIPAEITAVDHKDCAVQVNVKPGVWLSCSDWDKKLRVAVYEVPHGVYDSMNEPQFQEALGGECENINVLQLNDLYPRCPLDRIADFLQQDTFKGLEPIVRSHEAEDSVVRRISGFADSSGFVAAKAAREENAENRQDGMIVGNLRLGAEAAAIAAAVDAARPQEAFHEPICEDIARKHEALNTACAAVDAPLPLRGLPKGSALQRSSWDEREEVSLLPELMPCAELGACLPEEIRHVPEVMACAEGGTCVPDSNRQADLEAIGVVRPCSTREAIPPVTYVSAMSPVGGHSGICSEGRFAGYRCPQCGESGLESIQDAVDHCGKLGSQGAKPIAQTGIAAIETSSITAFSGVSRRVSTATEQALVEPMRTSFMPSEVQASTEIPSQQCSGHDAVELVAEEVSILCRPKLSSREPSLEGDNYDHQCQLAREHVKAASSAVICTENVDENRDSSTTQAGTPKEQLAENDVPRGHIERRTSNPLGANYVKPKTRILGYCCPKCGEGSLASLHEAVQHCRKPEEPVCHAGEGGEGSLASLHEAVQHCRETEEPICVTEEGTPCVETACAPLIQPMLSLSGEPVAYNSYGQPVIARQVDPETGTGRTMVLNDDGSCDVFGQQTIASLLSSTETEADGWIEALSDYQLRGLVHEMGQRLLETSHVYQARLNQWEHLSEKANLSFFGLSEDATDRELDLAYRQLSKKLHPDKNGGTEESKQRFQEMKTRYEALKKKRGEQESDEKKEATEEQAEDQNKEQSKEKDERTIEFDPTNRESLHGTFKKMHSQLSTLDSSMANLVRQLKRHGL